MLSSGSGEITSLNAFSGIAYAKNEFSLSISTLADPHMVNPRFRRLSGLAYEFLAILRLLNLLQKPPPRFIRHHGHVILTRAPSWDGKKTCTSWTKKLRSAFVGTNPTCERRTRSLGVRSRILDILNNKNHKFGLVVGFVEVIEKQPTLIAGPLCPK
jgi:hypothetical protein